MKVTSQELKSSTRNLVCVERLKNLHATAPVSMGLLCVIENQAIENPDLSKTPPVYGMHLEVPTDRS